MDDPTAVRTMAQSDCSGFYLAVDVPGSLMTGQAFEVVPGPRETPVMELFKAARVRVR
jgi:MOSC domain-containing protein YiiM